MSKRILNYQHHTNIYTNLPSNDQYKSIRNNLIRLEGLKNAEFKRKCNLCGVAYCSICRNRVLVPSKRPNRFLRRLLQNDTKNRTAYQKLSLKKFDKNAAKQKLVDTCPLCKYKETLMIAKDIPASNAKISIVDEEIIKVKKKKTNQEFAGLNKSAVLTVKKARRIMQMDDIQIKRKLDTKPQLDNRVVSVDNYRRMEIDNEQPRTLDFISLVTPETTSKDYSAVDPKSSAIITLQTPKTTRKKTTNSNIIDLSTPSDNKMKNKAKKDAKKERKRDNKKKCNEVLATTPKSAKKCKKQDALAKLLKKDSKLENTVSNLEKFLNTISK